MPTVMSGYPRTRTREERNLLWPPHATDSVPDLHLNRHHMAHDPIWTEEWGSSETDRRGIKYLSTSKGGPWHEGMAIAGRTTSANRQSASQASSSSVVEEPWLTIRRSHSAGSRMADIMAADEPIKTHDDPVRLPNCVADPRHHHEPQQSLQPSAAELQVHANAAGQRSNPQKSSSKLATNCEQNAFGTQAALRARRKVARTPMAIHRAGQQVVPGPPWQGHESTSPDQRLLLTPSPSTVGGMAFGSQEAMKARQKVARMPSPSPRHTSPSQPSRLDSSAVSRRNERQQACTNAHGHAYGSQAALRARRAAARSSHPPQWRGLTLDDIHSYVPAGKPSNHCTRGS